MIDIDKINNLLKENKSEEVLDILYEEYNIIFKKIAEKLGINSSDKNTIIDYIMYIKHNSDKYYGRATIISENLLDTDDNVSEENRIKILLEELDFWNKEI